MYIIGKIIFYTSEYLNKLQSEFLSKYYHKKIKKVGIGCSFNGISKITGLNNIEIGNNVHIGNNAYIRGEGGLKIGDNVHISRNLVLYTHNHNYEGECLPYDNSFIYRKVIIEKNVWIGMNVKILPGTHIFEGAIIGAGAVVAGKIDQLSIIGASNGRLLKSRDNEHYKFLEKNSKYGGKGGRPIL